MRGFAWFLALALVLSCSSPLLAQDEPKPEFVVEKMAFKLARGVTNFATAIVELPKQSYLTVRDRGNVGYVIGPLKGVGMTLYRAFIGATEAVFFPVPQPGYYDPMIEPEFVWKGWEPPQRATVAERSETTEAVAGEKQ
uniref:Exosortase system-associated protein, TIGR04073 family n=1 Tax=Geobacter metallireducens TaxID=28232 RepID=A0A831XKC6_GEOME